MQDAPGRQWLVPLGAVPDPRFRLFCFPPAGSGAAAYRSWVPLVPPSVELVAIVPPGRESRFAEPPLADMAALVQGAAAAIAPWCTVPFALFGHSLGSLVAHEVARRLSASGRPPQHVFVSGHVAPTAGPRRAPIAHLPDAAFLEGLIALGGTPREILDAPDLLALLTPMLRADFGVAERYRLLPGPLLSSDLTAFGGHADPWVDAPGLDAWRDLTSGDFERRFLPGDHFYLASAAAPLLRCIQDHLARRLVTA